MAWPWDRIPPWATTLIGQPLSDMAERIRQPEFVSAMRGKVDQAIADLPEAAARRVDQVVRSARKAAESVQRWAADRTAPAIDIINATGVLLPVEAEHCPVPSEVGLAWAAAASTWAAHATATEGSRAARALRGEAKNLVGQPARLAHRWNAAVMGAALVARDQGPLLIPRSHAFEVTGAGPLPEVLRSVHPQVIEVGALQASLTGLELPSGVGAGDRAGAIVFWLNDATQVDVFSALSHAPFQSLVKIVIAPHVWPADPQLPTIIEPLTIAKLFAAGAQVVVTPGAGLLGGVDSGLVWGDESRLQSLDSQLLWKTLLADAPTHAACATALQIWSQPSPAQRLPILTALQASQENLRHRANQLLIRLAPEESIVGEVTDGLCRIWPGAGPQIPSVQLRLKKTDVAAGVWVKRLAGQVPLVWAAVHDDSLVLDLRTIPPSAEGTLVAALVGEPVEAATTP